MIVRWVSSGSASSKLPSRRPCRRTSRTAPKTAFISANVSGSKRGAPEASSRSMMGGNQGRAAASWMIVATQRSSFSGAVPGPSAMPRALALTARNMSRSTSM